MKRIILLLLTFLLLFSSCSKKEEASSSGGGPLVIVDDDYKTPDQTISESIEPKERDGFPKIVINSYAKPEAYMTAIPNGLTNEATPTILTVNGKGVFISATGYSSVAKFKSGKTMLDFFYSLDSLEDSVTRLTNPGNRDERGLLSSSKLNENSQWENGAAYWKRSYFGVLDAVTVSINGEKRVVMATHGENKNEKYPSGQKYSNTILPKRAYLEDEYSGVQNGVYNDNPETYFAFTGLINLPESKLNSIQAKEIEPYDLGPVVWPLNPYLITSGSGINQGVKHPSLLAADKFLYLFYVDNGYLRAARADLSSNNPFSFKKCLNGQFEQRALPDGFDKNDRTFLSQGIGESDKILRQSGTIFFSAAKIKGTDWYLGVEETSKLWPKTQVRLRLSKDLINWSDGIVLPDSEAAYTDIKLHYPKFIAKDGLSSKEIELEEFYVTGIAGSNTGRNAPHIAKLSISLAE